MITIVLQKGDVLKVDFGVHVKGRILDSAFTLNFEPTYDKLIEAVKAATNTGVRVRQRHSSFPQSNMHSIPGGRYRCPSGGAGSCYPGNYGIV